jgi:hypothetical protein
MSRTMRAAVLALAVAVLVVGFVIAQQAGDDDASGGATVAQTQQAEQQPEAGSDDGLEAGRTPAEQEATPITPEPPLVRVRGGEPVGGVQQLAFDKGDRVDFRVRADAADEIHVHGYDVVRQLPAGETVRIRFPADIDGRFEVELHGTGTQIARLEVQP